MNTIMTPKIMGRVAKIVKEIQTGICIDDADVEILEEILKDELNAYYNLVDGYYEEEYYNALSYVRNSAYDNGYADGYADGCTDSYDDYSENNS